MEEVRGEGHPVGAVVDIGICIVPRPPEQLDPHDIIREVNENDEERCHERLPKGRRGDKETRRRGDEETRGKTHVYVSFVHKVHG